VRVHAHRPFSNFDAHSLSFPPPLFPLSPYINPLSLFRPSLSFLLHGGEGREGGEGGRENEGRENEKGFL